MSTKLSQHLPLLSDTSSLFMDYIISKWGEETIVLPLNLVKKIILDPRNVEKRYKRQK